MHARTHACTYMHILASQPMLQGKVKFYTVSKNDINIAHYNFNAHQLILVIFGRDVAERVCCRTVICYPTTPN